MQSVYINGIGIISRYADSISELSERKEKPYPTGKLDFSMTVDASKVRRCSRYIKMAVNTAAKAIEDSVVEAAEGLQTGTIISTGFGAAESNIAFSDSVVKGDPSACSPTVFSATVPNSCVGQICIINGFKGASTVLTGGDPLEYSSLLLASGKAKQIVCGAVEEYNDELVSALKSTDILSDTEISEGCVMLMLSREAADNTYCRAIGFSSESLDKYPYVHKLKMHESIKTMKRVFSRIAKKPDIILTAKNGSYFDEAEDVAVRSVFGNDVFVYEPKKLFGETLGCGYMMNVALGACMLRKGTYKTVLVTGIDVHGNYLSVLLEV